MLRQNVAVQVEWRSEPVEARSIPRFLFKQWSSGTCLELPVHDLVALYSFKTCIYVEVAVQK